MLLPSKCQCKIQCLHQELKQADHAQNDPFGGVIMNISRICLHAVKVKSVTIHNRGVSLLLLFLDITTPPPPNLKIRVPKTLFGG